MDGTPSDAPGSVPIANLLGVFARSCVTALGSQNFNPSQFAFQHLCEHKVPKARKMYIVWRLETSQALAAKL